MCCKTYRFHTEDTTSIIVDFPFGMFALFGLLSILDFIPLVNNIYFDLVLGRVSCSAITEIIKQNPVCSPGR